MFDSDHNVAEVYVTFIMPVRTAISRRRGYYWVSQWMKQASSLVPLLEKFILRRFQGQV